MAIEQHLPLKEDEEKMMKFVEHYVKEILDYQFGGSAILHMDEVCEQYEIEYSEILDQEVFQKMLSEREEIKEVARDLGKLLVEINDAFVKSEPQREPDKMLDTSSSLFLNVHLIRKAEDYALQRCEVAEVIELSREEFNELKYNPLQDHSFITDNKDKLEYENVSTTPCIMFLDSEGDDGILVDPQGYDYARYSAYIANARQLCRLRQYPSLENHNRDMESLVGHYVKEVLNTQQDGEVTLSLSDVGEYYQSEYQSFLDYELFQNMMTERPEFDGIEENCGDLFIHVKTQFQHGQLRELSQHEVDVICAKHILWLNDAGGERANLQNCYLKNLNLYGKDLSNSYCEGALFENCDIHSTDFSNAEMESARFDNCYMQDIFANKTNFIQADFIGCDISNSVVCDSILTSATMQKCNVDNTQITNCQLDGFEHPATDMSATACVTGQTEEQTNSLNYS